MTHIIHWILNAHSLPLYSSNLKSFSLTADIFTYFQRKLNKIKQTKNQAGATTYLHEYKDISVSIYSNPVRVSKEEVSCLPSRLGVQELGPSGFYP